MSEKYVLKKESLKTNFSQIESLEAILSQSRKTLGEKESEFSYFFELLQKNMKKYDYFQFLFKDICKELLRNKKS